MGMVSKDEANAIADALMKPGIERRRKSRIRFPELQAFPIEQRDDVLRAAMRAARRGWPIPAAIAAVVALGALAIAILWFRPSLAMTFILATSVGTIGVARLMDARTRKALQLMQPADPASR
jgi:ferric-dicitrate binding protein FerR (iron transport regulator)